MKANRARTPPKVSRMGGRLTQDLFMNINSLKRQSLVEAGIGALDP